MGVAIAAAAWRRGANVTLVAGPLSVAPPIGVLHVPVESTEEMRDAVGAQLGGADVLIMSAAPADYRPAERASVKIKKTGAKRTLDLEETPDILLSGRDQRRAGSVVVGFALETNDVLANARRKLDQKALDLIVVNDATETGAGFGVDTNRVTLLTRGASEPEELPLMSKSNVADAILDRVQTLLNGR
jgi:phosphopantothenoylcysteine decarboxylase/phosphopantothenate--cysteine ligase